MKPQTKPRASRRWLFWLTPSLVLALLFALAFTPACRRMWDLEWIARNEGQPIVDAIYTYKRIHGLWPMSLQDVVGKHMALNELVGLIRSGSRHSDGFVRETYASGWSYSWSPGGGWAFQTERGARRWSRYIVLTGRGWTPRVVALPGFRIHEHHDMVCRLDRVFERARRRELPVRIAREPDALLHRRGLISLAVMSGQAEADEVLAMCAKQQDDFPDWAWPRIVALQMNLLEGRCAPPDEATGESSGADAPLAVFEAFCRDLNRQEDAPLTSTGLYDGARKIALDGQIGEYTLAHFASDAVALAYRRGRYGLAVELAQRAEELLGGEEGMASPVLCHVRVLAAAAHLEMEDKEAARLAASDAERLLTHRSWNVDGLEDAREIVAALKDGKLPWKRSGDKAPTLESRIERSKKAIMLRPPPYWWFFRVRLFPPYQ